MLRYRVLYMIQKTFVLIQLRGKVNIACGSFTTFLQCFTVLAGTLHRSCSKNGKNPVFLFYSIVSFFKLNKVPTILIIS